MPTISNATVAAGTGLSTAGGGRKLVRLANGNMYSAIKNGNYFVIYKSVDGGSNWSQHSTAGGSFSFQDVALATKGNDLYLIWAYNDQRVHAYVFINESATPLSATLDSSQTAIGNVSLAINEAGTELLAGWSSKNSTLSAAFNGRTARGTINPDGSVTWSTVTQLTDSSASNHNNPTATYVNGVPYLFYEVSGSANRILMFTTKFTTQEVIYPPSSGVWGNKSVYSVTSYNQSSPSATFVPTAINGLANGRLWVAWHGKDATDSAKFNVRVSYSDDGGVTWATPTKLTSGNLYDRQNVSLSADKTGKVFALYEEHQWSPDLDIYMRTFSGGSWGAPVAVAEADPAAESNPSALVDYSLMMTTPPFVFMSGTDGIKFSGNFNVGASVSPASGALGNKETATLTAYNVTPEAGSTVTQIVEKVNGVTVNTFNNPASLSRTLTVPTATWDTLAYFASHTASITVTDSNGAQTVTTYSFDKRLATGASLLEATKANTDAKNRISTKRDALAAQVGLSAGSTFDAISAQLASGTAFKKFATGTTATGTGSISYGGQTSYPITVQNLSFKPSTVILWTASSNAEFTVFHVNADFVSATGQQNIIYQPRTSVQVMNTTNANYYVNDVGFVLPGRAASLTYDWVAIE